MEQTMVFDTPKAIQAYQAITLKHAIKLYARTGMKVNSAYTPKAMLAKASELTGQVLKRGQYDLAVIYLDTLIAKLAETGCPQCGDVRTDGLCDSCGAGGPFPISE